MQYIYIYFFLLSWVVVEHGWKSVLSVCVKKFSFYSSHGDFGKTFNRAPASSSAIYCCCFFIFRSNTIDFVCLNFVKNEKTTYLCEMNEQWAWPSKTITTKAPLHWIHVKKFTWSFECNGHFFMCRLFFFFFSWYIEVHLNLVCTQMTFI